MTEWTRFPRVISVAVAGGALVAAALWPSMGRFDSTVSALPLLEQLLQPGPDVQVVKTVQNANGCCQAIMGPDGDSYVFYRGRELWLGSLSNPNASRKIADTASSPRWLADGHLIYAALGDAPALPASPPSQPEQAAPVASPVAGQGAQASPPPIGNALSPDDVKRLANRKQVVPVKAFDLKTNTTEEIGLTDNPERVVARGNNVAAPLDGKLRLIDRTSKASRDVPGLDVSFVEFAKSPQFALSPDGRLAVAIDTTLVVVDPTTGSKTTLTNRLEDRIGDEFSWSTDGTMLAYAVSQDRFAPPELWVYTAGGSRQVYSTGGGGAFASVTWLPGRDLILFHHYPRGNDTSRTAYLVVSAHGGAARTLITGGVGLYLSSDGHYLSFTRDGQKPEDRGNFVATLKY